MVLVGWPGAVNSARFTGLRVRVRAPVLRNFIHVFFTGHLTACMPFTSMHMNALSRWNMSTMTSTSAGSTSVPSVARRAGPELFIVVAGFL